MARAETRRFEESSGHKIHLSPPRRPRLQDQMEQLEQMENKTSESPKAIGHSECSGGISREEHGQGTIIHDGRGHFSYLSSLS